MRAWIAGALCLLAAVPARAGVVVQAGVPFTVAQLAAAISARGGPAQGEIDLEVSRPGPRWLTLVTPAGRWDIEIGDATGETAARIVALHVVELAMIPAPAPADATVSAAPPITRTAAAPIAEPGAAAVPAAAMRVTASPGAPPRYRLATLGIGSRGVRAGDFTSVGGALEVTRRGRWIAGGGIAWQRGLTIDRDPGAPISEDLIRARAVAGVALGPAELVAGGFAGPMFVDGGTGMIRRWAAGLAAEVRAEARVSATWSFVVAAGAEVFRSRVEVQLQGARLGATPRVALGGGIGLAWTAGGAR